MGLHGETIRVSEPPLILMQVSTASIVLLGVNLPLQIDVSDHFNRVIMVGILTNIITCHQMLGWDDKCGVHDIKWHVFVLAVFVGMLGLLSHILLLLSRGKNIAISALFIFQVPHLFHSVSLRPFVVEYHHASISLESTSTFFKLHEIHVWE